MSMSSSAFQNGTRTRNLTLLVNTAKRAQPERAQSWDEPQCVHTVPRVTDADAPWSTRRKLTIILGLNAVLWVAILAIITLL